MYAMYQPPATSLPEYARPRPPIFQNISLDFCNSFWGFDDAGVNVLFARMRGAVQTTEDLNAFWNERASIEEDYAKRLAKLAQMTIGRDETGDLRKSLDTMAAETERQARLHLTLAQQFRSEFEVSTTALHVRLLHHKTTRQAGIEKLFKTKQSWESCVNEVREKYEQECARIKSFKAQASLVLGKDRERINVKLQLIQKSIQTHERKLSNFSMVLKETITKWERDWKSFCDTCQDLEEHRMHFMKHSLLTYTNAVSRTYTADALCCESMIFAFLRMEAEKDVANFVLESGSGNQIPDAFDFVNYSPPDAIPSTPSQPTSRIAEFTRSTSRELPLIQNSMPLALKEGPVVNAADIGDGKGTIASSRHDPYVGESVVDASSLPIPLSSKAQPISYTNDIQLTASMANQVGNLDPLTEPLEQFQSARLPLPIPLLSMAPKSTQPAGVEVARALADWQPVFEEPMSSSQRSRTAGRHTLSLNQISSGGDGGGARLPAATPEHHDPNLVWGLPSQPLLQAVDDVLDSDEAKESERSAVDEPEMYMPLMLPQKSGQLNLFLKQHEHSCLNSNVNPINFVIKKTMMARRIAHRTDSTSPGCSMKPDTPDSFISSSSGSAENFSPVSLSTSW